MTNTDATTKPEPMCPTYKLIDVPEGAKDYTIKSVQAQCDSALRRVLIDGLRLEYIEGEAKNAAREEVYAYRRAFEKQSPHDKGGYGLSYAREILTDEVRRWTLRMRTESLETAARLAKFRDALKRDDISHVTSGHPVSPDAYHVYRRDPKSPSGCILLTSIGREVPGASFLMANRSTCAGGQRGNPR